jgi:hypothetical protein
MYIKRKGLEIEKTCEKKDCRLVWPLFAHYFLSVCVYTCDEGGGGGRDKREILNSYLFKKK